MWLKRKLYRDRWNKKVSGVCGGLGQYFKVDPTIIRLAFLFLCLLTGVLPLLLVYILATILIPLGPKTYIQYKCKKLYRLPRQKIVSGICAGIGEFLKLDPTLVRIVVVLTILFTGFLPGAIAYMIGTSIIPEKM